MLDPWRRWTLINESQSQFDFVKFLDESAEQLIGPLGQDLSEEETLKPVEPTVVLVMPRRPEPSINPTRRSSNPASPTPTCTASAMPSVRPVHQASSDLPTVNTNPDPPVRSRRRSSGAVVARILKSAAEEWNDVTPVRESKRCCMIQ